MNTEEMPLWAALAIVGRIQDDLLEEMKACDVSDPAQRDKGRRLARGFIVSFKVEDKLKESAVSLS